MHNRGTRRLVSSICIGLIIAVAMLSPVHGWRMTGNSIAAQNSIRLDVPFFSQVALKNARDSHGRPYNLGNSNLPLWANGCGVASLAMVFRYYGVDTDVVRLNDTLRSTGAFSKALLNWSKPETICRAGAPWVIGVRRVNTSHPKRYQELIDKELAAGRPVIAFLGRKHYVVLVGRDKKGNYLINDPWKKRASDGKGIPLGKNFLGLRYKDITQFVFVYPHKFAPTNAIPVGGKIAKKYFALGGSEGVLGDPVAGERALPEHEGEWQKFEGGAIFALPEGAFALRGPVWRRFEADGGIVAWGIPQSDTYSYFVGRTAVWQADFEKASIMWEEDKPPEKVRVLTSKNAFRGEYFANPDLRGSPVYRRFDGDLFFNWGDSVPGPWLKTDSFSVHWTGKIRVRAPIGWWYNFTVATDGGIRVWIDGREILDRWEGSKGQRFRKWLWRGEHTLTVEYRHQQGKATLMVLWDPWPIRPAIAADDAVSTGDVVPAPVVSKRTGSETEGPMNANTPSPVPPTVTPVLIPTSVYPPPVTVPHLKYTLSGHEAPVYQVRYGPDGRKVFSASGDGTVRIWDSSTGKLIRVSPMPTGEGECQTCNVVAALSVSVSPDGKLLAVGYVDNAVRLWDTENFKLQRILKGHVSNISSIWSVDFSPDGSRLVTADANGIVRLWDVHTGKEVSKWCGSTPWMQSKYECGPRLWVARFSPDGTMILTAGDDGVARIWNARTGAQIATFGKSEEGLTSAAFSPDGKLIAVAGRDNLVWIWDVSTKKIIVTLRGHTSWIRSVAFSPDGRYVISSGDDRTVRIWELNTGKEKFILRGHTDTVWSVDVSPDGQCIVTGSGDKSVKLWHFGPATPQTEPEIQHPVLGRTPYLLPSTPISLENIDKVAQITHLGKGLAMGVDYSPDGSLLAVASSIGIYLYDAGDLREVEFLKTESSVNSVAFSPDGSLLASGSGDPGSGPDSNAVRLWRVSDGKLLRTLKGYVSGVESVAFSPDGSLLAAVAGDAVRLWRVSDGKLLRTLKPPEHPVLVSSVAFSPDGSLLALGSDETVRLWRVSDGKLLRTLNTYSNGVRSVAFSPDGSLLASGSDEAIRLWRVSDGKLLRTLEPLEHTIMGGSVAFSPDGSLLASGCSSHVCLWRMSDGKLLRTLDRYSSWVRSVVFSPDGSLLAAAANNAVCLWRVSDGKLLRTLNEYMSSAESVAFSPDGTILASGSGSNIRLWRVSDGKLLRTLNTYSNRVRSVAFSPDGSLLASGSGAPWSGPDGNAVRLWRVSDGKLLRTLVRDSNWVRSVAFSPDGSLLASESHEAIRLWRVSDGKLLRILEDASTVLSVAFSPDGSLLASGSDEAIRLWRVSDGKLLRTLKATGDSVAFSPDGSLLASGSGNDVCLWRVSDGKLLYELWHASPVTSVTFSHDGSVLASGTEPEDCAVRLWRVSDGKLLRELRVWCVNSVTFASDDSLLAFGPGDGTVRLWGIKK